MEGYRLAAQQKHLWGLGDAPGLRTAATVAIEGDLDSRRLRAALEEVVGRHQALRTHLRPWEGYRFPVQVIDGSPRIEWRELEVGGPDGDLRAPFELATGALVRASLVREGPGHHRLHLVLPALAADAVSLGLLFRETVAAYGAGPGRGPGEDDVVQFLQVSEWQNALAEDEDRKEGEEHWRRCVEAAPVLRLPYERAGAGDGEPFAPEIETAPVDDPALPTRAAAALGCESVEEIALATWVCVLRRLTDQADLLVERVFPGRGIEELSEVCGLLARSVPLRLRIERGFRFDEVVRRLREEVEAAERWHPHHPRFEGSRALVPPREEALLFEGVEWPPEAEAAGARFALHRPVAGTDRFKAKLVCARRGDRLALELHYDPRRLGAEAARCLLGQVRECLASAAEDPARRLEEISLLPPEERSRLVARAVAYKSAPRRAAAVHELFELQAAETPGAPAATSGGESLTYGELDQRSASLAGRLRRARVRRGEPVALYLERSLDVVVALLGALRAGGAYAPLDLGSPPGRLSRMLAELGRPVLVTQERLLDRLPEGARDVVVVDRQEGSAGGAAADGRAHRAAPALPEDLAYVLFTSGSTGEPKGVMVQHRQLASYVLAVSERMALPAGSRFAMVSTFAADLGHTALFPALCTGGCVDVVPEEHAAEADAFGDYLAANPVDALKIVPSHLGALLSAARPERCLPRRLLVVGGEAVGWDLVEEVAALAPECRVLNHYGPTETTVGALAADLDPASPDRGAAPPLGASIAHATACVLDDALELAPVGVPGEIFLGGAGVSRGYLGAPGATALSFLPHPFAARPGERVYRTGDLARSRPDGDLEFLGRRDHQVKIRGFRVELPEIEASLRRHPAVRDAVVGLRGEPAMEASVVAWWVRRRDREAGLAELRDHLLERLPRYMVPAAFVEIEALPRTANGKVDRAALPAPDAAARAAAGAGEPPATPVEEVIAGYWEELLRVPRVGRDGHFFELGGHSLVATQLVARLREAFGIDLRLRQLFDAPTLAGVAAEVEAALRLHRPAEVPPIQPAPRQPDAGLPLSFGQRRLWLSQRMDPKSSAYNIPTSLGVEGPLSVGRLQTALTELVRRHEVLRTALREVDGEPLQFVEPLRPVPVPVVDLRLLSEPDRAAEAARLAAVSARVPFDLESGRPLRIRVLRLGDASHVLLFLVHHVASDAWSIRVLVREVVGHYEDLAAGRPTRLPEPPIQYADFAAWQRRWLTPEALPAEVEFWRRELADPPPPLDLADRPRPPVMTHRGASQSRTLEGELVEDVRALGRREGATSFMTLLTALQVVLGHRSGSVDVVVGTNVAGRSHTATEGLIGFFLNMVVLRTDLGGDPTFAELLHRVRATAVQAFAHQDLPFDQVVEVVEPRRDPGRHPIFQVKLDYQRLPGSPGAPAELALRPMELDYATSHCDLTLYVEDVDDGLVCSLEYNADLFEERTALEMLDQHRTVLELAAAEPGIRLAELWRALAEGEERHRRTTEEEFRETRLRGLRTRTRRRSAEKPSQMEVG